MTEETFCESNDIIFREMELPTTVHGFSFYDDEGRFVVVLNTRSGILKNRETAAHELRHIMRGDNANTAYIEYE